MTDPDGLDGIIDSLWSGWNTVSSNVSYAAQVAWETPGYIPQTFQNGQAADSLVGTGAGFYDHAIGNPLTSLTGRNWNTDVEAPYGHVEDFNNGRTLSGTSLVSQWTPC